MSPKDKTTPGTRTFIWNLMIDLSLHEHIVKNGFFIERFLLQVQTAIEIQKMLLY
jgi:hypothetical protein